MKKISKIVVIVILALIAFRFVSVKFGEFQRNKINKANAIPSVQVDTVKESEISKSIEIAGRIESSDKVDIVARVDGYLQKRHFTEGDCVKKGQLLLQKQIYINQQETMKEELN